MSKIQRYLFRFKTLSSWERGVLMRAMLLLPIIALALKLLGFQRSLRLLLPDAVTDCLAENSPAGAQHIARLVEVAALRGWYGGNCLSRSLTLSRLLRTEGLSATLLIGVRKNIDQLEAHAWVECCGAVINDGPEVSDRFTPLWTQPFARKTVEKLQIRRIPLIDEGNGR